MLNHVHKTTINTLSDSLSLSLYKDSFAFSLLLLPALTHSCTHKLFGNLSLSLSIHCTLLHKHSHPTQRTLWGWSKGFWGSEAEAHTWAAVCVWRALIKARGEQPSGGGCRMWAVIIEEGVRLAGGPSLLRHTSTAKNKHLLISSPPPPSPNHCLLPVYGLTETSGNRGSGNNGSYSLQWQ